MQQYLRVFMPSINDVQAIRLLSHHALLTDDVQDAIRSDRLLGSNSTFRYRLVVRQENRKARGHEEDRGQRDDGRKRT